MAEETLKEKTAKGLFWGGLSNFLQQGIGMVFGIVIARILSANDYGLVAMLAIFSAIATTLIDSGFTVALINKRNAGDKDYNAVFWFSALMGLGIYAILFFAAPLIAKFFEQPVLTGLARVLFLGFVISSTGIVHHAILLKNMKAKQMGAVNIAGVLISGIIGLVLALNGFAYWGLVVQQVSALLISALLRWYFSGWRPSLKIDFSPLREMIGLSSKMFISNVVVQVQGNAFNAFLGKVFNTALLGYYSQGTKWMTILNSTVTGMISTVAQPVFVQVNDNKERQLRVFRKMIRFSAFIVFPAFIGLAFIAPEFIRIALGEKWMRSVIFMQIMCLWGMSGPFNLLYANVLISHGKSSIYLTGNIIITALQILVCSILFIMQCSVAHIVFGYVISYCFGLIYLHIFTKELIGLKYIHVIRDIFPYLIITVVSALISKMILHYIDNIYLKFTGKILFTAGIYLLMLHIFNSKILKESIILLKRKTIILL